MQQAVEIFFSVAIANLAGLVAPGPITLLLIRYAHERDHRRAFFFISGILFSDLLVASLLCAGLASTLAHRSFQLVIAPLGSLVLGWLGFDLVRSANSAASAMAAYQKQKTTSIAIASSLASGFLVTILSPIYWVWWGSAGLILLGRAISAGTPGMVCLGAALTVPTFAWFGVVYALLAGGSTRIPDRYLVRLQQICGLLLIGSGGWLLVRVFAG